MSKLLLKNPATTEASGEPKTPMQRRAFLRYSGAGLAVTGLVLAGCDDKLDEVSPDLQGQSSQDHHDVTLVDVGSGDFGVLNFAYALEQLEAAFYATVLLSPYYASATPAEKQVLKELEAHERVHVDFLKQAITALGGTPIRTLLTNFSAINFSSRDSVLGAAMAFEDLGVAAYNGAGKLIANPAILTLAGKIVSVEARHAAIIRDLVRNGSFVGPDVIDFRTGLEMSKTPEQVVAAANTFLLPNSKISVSNLPKD